MHVVLIYLLFDLSLKVFCVKDIIEFVNYSIEKDTKTFKLDLILSQKYRDLKAMNL